MATVTMAPAQKRALIGLTAVVLILVLIPEVIRFGLVSNAQKLGLEQLEIDDIDLNIFTGQLGLSKVGITQGGASALQLENVELNIAWVASAVSGLTIERLVVDGAVLNINQDSNGQWLVVVPIVSATEEQPPADNTEVPPVPTTLPSIVVADLNLRNIDIVVNSEILNGTLQLEQLALLNFSTINDYPYTLSLDALWNQAPLSISATGTVLDQQQDSRGKITLKDFDLAVLEPLLALPVAGLLSVDVDMDLQRTAADDLQLTAGSLLQLKQFKGAMDGLELSGDNTEWQGDINVALQESGLHYSVAGDIELGGLLVHDSLISNDLLGIGALRLAGLQLDQDLTLVTESLILEQLTGLKREQDEQAKLGLGSLEIKDVRYAAEQGVVIASIGLTALQYQALITESGELEINALLAELQAAHAPDDKPVDEASDPQDTVDNGTLLLVIGEVLISEDSHIGFRDLSLDEPLTLQLDVHKIQLVDIDSTKPDTPANIAINASMGEFSTISADGQVQAFAQPLAVSLAGEIKGIDMRAFSAYGENFLGYSFVQGQLSHQFEIVVADDAVDASNTLTLGGLEVAAAKSEQSTGIDSKLSLPLGMALDTLRDKNGTITLDVPITGPTHDIGVGVGEVVSDALSKALMGGATHYLTYALQPYGMAFMAASYVGEKLSQINLDPIEFAAGSAELPASSQDYIEKLGSLLDERPALTLALCGSAGDSDKQLLLPGVESIDEEGNKRLIALAEDRAALVKRQLLAQGLDASRLFICQSKYQAEAIGGVTLGI